MTFPYEVSVPLVKDVRSQAPQAICEVKPMNGRATLLVTNAPPFDNPVLRRAMQLSLDRKSFIDILGEGQYDIGGVLQPPPEGIWGMPKEMLQQLTGYGPDVQKNREEARAMMRSLGYGPDNRLKVKLVVAQHPLVSRSRGDPDRSAQGNLDRRRTGDGRDRQLGPEADAQGFYCRDEPLGQRRRRPGQPVL